MKPRVILFWISFVPVGLVIVVVGSAAGLLCCADDKLYSITQRFEKWCFDE